MRTWTKSWGSALTAVLAALVLAGAAAANVVNYNFLIDGLQETPPVQTPGSGTGVVTLNTITGEFTWDIEYLGLLGNVTAAHFHIAPIGDPGPVVLDIGSSGPLGGTSGTFVGSVFVSMNDVNDILAGLWYVNIHTNLYPAGEIRGQVIPAPGALALMGLGIITLRRRRRSGGD